MIEERKEKRKIRKDVICLIVFLTVTFLIVILLQVDLFEDLEQEEKLIHNYEEKDSKQHFDKQNEQYPLQNHPEPLINTEPDSPSHTPTKSRTVTPSSSKTPTTSLTPTSSFTPSTSVSSSFTPSPSPTPSDLYYFYELKDVSPTPSSSTTDTPSHSVTPSVTPSHTRTPLPSPSSLPEEFSVSNHVHIYPSFPPSIRECENATIVIKITRRLELLDPLNLPFQCYIECTQSSTNLTTFQKFLPPLPSYYDENLFVCSFYPDDTTNHCVLGVVYNENAVRLSGLWDEETDSLLHTYNVITSRSFCFPYHSLDVPTPNYFVVLSDKGKFLWSEKNKISIHSGDLLRLLIRPLPYLYSIYDEDELQSIEFIGWMESDQARQNIDILAYDKEKMGYPVILHGMDAGEFTLFIVLNSIWSNKEVLEKPLPINVGPMKGHYYYPEFLYRCQISGSAQIKIKVKHHHKSYDEYDYDDNNNNTLIIDNNNNNNNNNNEINNNANNINKEDEIAVKRSDPGENLIAAREKCREQNLKGRWIRYVEGTECAAPNCTGDIHVLQKAVVWYRAEYLWVPYQCYLHLYNAESFSRCAKEKKIEWIHVIGDSLPREFVSYTMTLMGLHSEKKFQEAGEILGDSNVSLTFYTVRDLHSLSSLQEVDIFRSMDTLKEHLNTVHLFDFDNERPRPNVLIMNTNTAYVMYLQSLGSYEQFLQEMVLVFGDTCKNEGIPIVHPAYNNYPTYLRNNIINDVFDDESDFSLDKMTQSNSPQSNDHKNINFNDENTSYEGDDEDDDNIAHKNRKKMNINDEDDPKNHPNYYQRRRKRLVGDKGLSEEGKLRCYWYGQPTVWNEAHGGTEYITETRRREYERLSRQYAEQMGFYYIDTSLITHSRPDESSDGLHYLVYTTENEGHKGFAAGTLQQSIYNLLFDDCY